MYVIDLTVAHPKHTLTCLPIGKLPRTTLPINQTIAAREKGISNKPNIGPTIRAEKVILTMRGCGPS